MDSVGSQCPYSFRQVSIRAQDLVCACLRCDLHVAFGASSGDNWRSRAMRQLNSGGSDRPSAALHQNGSSLDRARDINGAMSGYTGNAETGTLLQRHALGKSSHLQFKGTAVYSAAVPKGR
jgi:hypothetical protein